MSQFLIRESVPDQSGANIVKIVVGALLYLLVVFPLGFVWHLVLFRSRFDEMGYIGRAEPIVAFGLLAMAAQAIACGTLYTLLARQFSAASAAAGAVGLITFVIWSAQVLAHLAKFEVEAAPFLMLQSGYFLLQFLLVFLAYWLVFTRLGPQ